MAINQELDRARSHPDVYHGLKSKGKIGNIIRSLRRLLVALGGRYAENNDTDVSLVDKIAELAENGQISPSIMPSVASKIWYATCSTASGTGAKVATSFTGDFVLATGSMARVKFTTSNTAANPTISIDGSTAKTIQPKSGTSGMANLIAAGEVVDLVYDGTNFIMSKGSSATTTFYGITKLNSSTSSTSTTEAATPSAVKAAYDLASSTDASLMTYTRPNLLDNWYFVGGGSQQGNGIFPINSIGQTVYQSSGNVIDRWTTSSAGYYSISLLPDFIRMEKIVATSTARNMAQKLTTPMSGTFTVSALYKTSANARVALRLAKSDSSYIDALDLPASSSLALESYTFTTSGSNPLGEVSFHWATNTAVGEYADIVAVKLELGSSQTLAHQENGAWVLNEVPKFVEETVISNGLNSGGGYCKLPDGTMFQWGYVSGLSFSSQNMISGEVTFDYPFVTALYSPRSIISPVDTGNNEYAFRAGSSCTGTKLSWSLFSGSGNPITVNNRGFQWLAIGRWK